MRYGILGHLEVYDGTRMVPVAHGRSRLLLAVLLVHADAPVSSEKLIDALWGETPPPTASRSLYNLVSGLRKALGPERLITHPRGGYQLSLDGDELDAARFQILAAGGRDALAAADAEQAARLLEDGLALWRGPAFGELAYATVLVAEVARLEELRLVAVEDRIDADLALGRHSELVAELDALVVDHPLRERMRGQLILALYRSGRQADALRAYADARRRLVDELGIEPGPPLRDLERAVLQQDPEISLPAPVRDPARTIARGSSLAVARRHPWPLALAGTLLVAAAIAGMLVAGDGPAPKPAGAAVVTGDLLVAIDPSTNTLAQRATIGDNPTSVTVGDGVVWALNSDDRTVSRVDLRTMSARNFSTETNVVDLAAGDDGLWVAQAAAVTPEQASFGEYAMPSQVTRVDALSGVARSTTRLPMPRESTMAVAPGDLIATGGGAAWVISRPGWVHRVDTRTGHRRTLRSFRAGVIAAGDGQVWISADRELIQLDPATGRESARVPLAAESVDALAVGDGAVWATDQWAGMLWRVDPERRTARTIEVGKGADSVAVGAGAVWVASSQLKTVSRIDPAGHRVAARIRVPGTPRGLAVGGGRVWVSVAGTRSALPAAGALRVDARVTALPGPPCGGVLTDRRGDPDYLIASDLPLGFQRESTLPMSAAVAFVLQQHDFRAGRFTLGLQSCDDAGAETGRWDPLKCRQNAHGYASNPAVIGIVGPLNSSCAAEMLPILNTAPGGPPALVSPTNGDPELVRDEPVSSADVLAELYPTGQRGYATVSPVDDYESAAGVLIARKLGDGRVFYLEDEFTAQHMPTYWIWFQRAARRAGLTIAGHEIWDLQAATYRDLAERVRASRVRAVYIGSGLGARLARVLRDLRASLDPHVAIIGPINLAPVSKLFAEAGDAARGVLITSPARLTDTLGPSGQRFIRAFGATQPGRRVTSYDVYAAAATEVLLDAIARSDGTREGVARALKQTRLADSVLGLFALTANGEPVASPITYLRAEHGGARPDGSPISVAGAEVVGRITPQERLVGPDAG